VANQIIDPPGVLANKNAPTVGFDPVENNGRHRSRGGAVIFDKSFC
jgi:hypothetical protein